MSFSENRLIEIKESKAHLLLVLGIAFLVTFKDAATGYPFSLEIKVRYIDDLLIVFLIVLIILNLIYKGKIKSSSLKFLILIFSLFLFTLIQHFMIKTNPLSNNFFFFFRDNFWYLPVFLVLEISYSKIKIKSLERIIDVFLIVQIVFFIVSQIYHLVSKNSFLIEDDVNGSLGANASHIISYLLIIFIPYCIKKKKWIFLIFIFLILITASARSLYLFFLLATLIIYLKRFELAKIIKISILSIVLLGPIYWYFTTKTSLTLNPVILYNIQNQDLEEGKGAARITFFIYSFNKILDDKNRLLFGYGPASYASRSGKTLRGSLYREYEADFPYENEFISGGSSLNAWIVEMGLVGFILILIFLFLIYKACPPNIIIKTCFLTLLLGLSVQKLFEEYSVGFFLWFMLSYYRRLGYTYLSK